MNIDSPIKPEQVEPLVRAYLEGSERPNSTARCAAAIRARLSAEANDVIYPEPASGIELAPESAIALAPGSGVHLAPVSVDAFLSESVLPLKRKRREFPWKWAAAACLLLAAGAGGIFTLLPEPASAYSLVTEAQTSLAKTTDRCYRVTSHLPRFWARRNPLLLTGEETLLWTHGDQFRVTTVTDRREYVWGQDEEFRFWFRL